MTHFQNENNIKVAAIYSRKSKFTEQGESIDNQVQLCKDYGRQIGIEEFLIYEDEGYSAKNIDRPQFKQLINDARDKKYKTIICYRLDRISRNISDFSNLINELENLEIGFVSVREHFDTTTPMGRAMMYIASVFAQLERETIAERVRDNMLELAKTGRWLGGQTPLGYKSEAITFIDGEMKQRKMYKLSPVESELEIVNLIFDLYYNKNSISQVNRYLILNNIKTKNGTLWTKKRIQLILRNPLYVKATSKVLEYLESLGIQTAGIPNGSHGILTYNKSKGSTKKREITEWIAAVSNHHGVIDADLWLEVQDILNKNKEKSPRLVTSSSSMLSGILKCYYCGSNMVVKHGHISAETGSRIHYFVCSLKDISYKTKCQNPNVRVDELELELINILKEIKLDKDFISRTVKRFEFLRDEQNYLKDMDAKIRKKTIANTAKIQRLVELLSENPSLAEYITKQIKLLESENAALSSKLKVSMTMIDHNDFNIDYLIRPITDLGALIEVLTITEQRSLLSLLIEKIIWNGKCGGLEVLFK